MTMLEGSDIESSLLEPVVRQGATRKSLSSQSEALDEQLERAKRTLEEESEMVVSLAEELENLGNMHKRNHEDLVKQSDALETVTKRRSDMAAAILAMNSQIESKEAEMNEAAIDDEKRINSLREKYKNISTQYFDLISTWSDMEKAMLKECVDS